jgi:hypothetical protein
VPKVAPLFWLVCTHRPGADADRPSWKVNLFFERMGDYYAGRLSPLAHSKLTNVHEFFGDKRRQQTSKKIKKYVLETENKYLKFQLHLI